MKPLEPKSLPLSGIQLIEASAGTGKTYTIALLYLRLLLEKGLGVSEILVVTFTKAATEELRGRIRLRIREAIDVLDGRTNGDPLLNDLLDQAGRTTANRQRLLDSLTLLDEAAIYTIHSFCQQMLQDHAFESGALFAMDILESEAPLRLQIMEDFWRIRFYNATPAEAEWAAACWQDPAGLLASLNGPLLQPEVVVVPQVDQETVNGLQQNCQTHFSLVRQSWPTMREQVLQILEEDPCLTRNAKSYRPDRIPMLLEAMDRLAARTEFPWHLEDGLHLLSASTMAGNIYKRCSTPPSHLFFDLFADFYSFHEQLLQSARIQVMLDARIFLFTELKNRKQERAVLFFDDLLTDLDVALTDSSSTLAGKIRTRFPTALVDEFQDTDPIQYRIFKTIYKQDGNLFMIGDPKQAIYSFRGADIFTYIEARSHTPENNTFTLDTNYRSTTPMVKAINTIFNRKNAFIFEPEIQFEPVRASGLVDNTPLILDNVPTLPLHSLWLGKPGGSPAAQVLNKGVAKDDAAELCAQHIKKLLIKSNKSEACIGTKTLVASDIAVLVRTHREAELIQHTLRRQNIASVYLSRNSVFLSPEAKELFGVLTGLTTPGSTGLVRNAMASVYFGLNGSDLARLNDDEAAWEEALNTIHFLRDTWLQKGFMPMFQQLITKGNLIRRLSADASGERTLTNILHLAELLQEASKRQHGLEQLIRWLQQQITNPDEDNSVQQLRLESDEELVQVVTIHKAKGLQYPIVFLPFLWSTRTPQAREYISFHNPNSKQLTVDLSPEPDPDHREMAQRERLAEELRLLYVALTRACCCCYFCWGHIKLMENTALAWLLHRSPSGGVTIPNENELQHQLLQLNGRQRLLILHTEHESTGPALLQRRKNDNPLSTPRFTGTVECNWQITSYSRLAAGHDPGPENIDIDRETRPTLPSKEGWSPFHFPRGAAAGTCLHAILELIDFTDASTELWVPTIQEQLQRAGINEEWVPVVNDWLVNIMGTDMGPCRLQDIPTQDKLNEMGFTFPLRGLDRNRLNTLLQSHGIPALPGGAERLTGLMKGFIDLIFRHQGKYYIADYKSNYLGQTAADYEPGPLALAMAEHRYDLQYLIYTLALHRYLKQRLPDYDYNDHFGGAFYLFLRGMHPQHPVANGIVSNKPDLELIIGIDQCCGLLVEASV